MAISFDSIGQECITVYANSIINVGSPCKFISSRVINNCTDGNAFHGILSKQSGNIVTLTVRGFVTVPYSGSTPTMGYCPLAAAGSGKVKKLDGAREYLVVETDTANSLVTFLL